MKHTLIATGLSLLLAAGCESDPDERTRLAGPRLLALQSSPPAFRGLEGQVRLSALAIDGDGFAVSNTELHFRVCSPWQFLVDPDNDCPEGRALSLTGDEVSAEDILEFYPPPIPITGTEGPPKDSESSACAPQALIEIPVIATLSIGDETLQTVKRIPFYAPEVDRQNPKIEEVEVQALADGQYQLSIRMDPESLDLECRNEALVPEAVRVFFYSTSGSFESSSVDIVPTPQADAEQATVLWTASEESASLFFVAIDNDGGVDWKLLSL